jgi:hypothetical protein
VATDDSGLPSFDYLDGLIQRAQEEGLHGQAHMFTDLMDAMKYAMKQQQIYPRHGKTAIQMAAQMEFDYRRFMMEACGLAFDFGRYRAETERQLVAMDAALMGDPTLAARMKAHLCTHPRQAHPSSPDRSLPCAWPTCSAGPGADHLRLHIYKHRPNTLFRSGGSVPPTPTYHSESITLYRVQERYPEWNVPPRDIIWKWVDEHEARYGNRPMPSSRNPYDPYR